MKCELCHKAEAETAIRKEQSGEAQELYVCRACAEETAQSGSSGAPAPSVVSPPPVVQKAEELIAQPLMDMILDAAFEIVGRAMHLAEPSCPVCGIQRHEYRKQSRLGCPACYEAFAGELGTAVFDLHRATRHVGKAPQRAKALWRRGQIKEKLDAAVKAQRYEEAVVLRDELRRLERAGEKEQGERGGSGDV